ncbi:hypothetical protein ADP8_05219 [Roseomonas mucosa]|nr:hypothetical protein ADP8_05219 [Roseomonas mucosa]
MRRSAHRPVQARSRAFATPCHGSPSPRFIPPSRPCTQHPA